MAMFKVMNGRDKYRNADAKEKLIEYAFRPDKAVHGYIGGTGVSMETAAEDMHRVSEEFGKPDGVQARHYVISFAKQELQDAALADLIGQSVINYIGREYQAVYSVHEDKTYLHIHIIANSVSFVDGHRCRGKRREFRELMHEIEAIIKTFGINRLMYISKKEN